MRTRRMVKGNATVIKLRGCWRLKRGNTMSSRQPNHCRRVSFREELLVLQQLCWMLTWVGQALFLKWASEGTWTDEVVYQVVLTRAHPHPSNSDLRLLRSHFQHLLQAYQHALHHPKPDTEGRKASYLRASMPHHSKDSLHKARHHLQGSVHRQVKAHLLGCHLDSSSKATHEQDDTLGRSLWTKKIAQQKIKPVHFGLPISKRGEG